MSINSNGLCLAAVLLLCGCAAGAAATSEPAVHPSIGSAGRHGVQIALAEYDRQIAALRATLHTPEFSNSTRDIDASIAALRSEVSATSARVQSAIAQKAASYAAREDAAVSALLAQSDAPAPSRQQVAQRLERDYQREYAQLRSGAQGDMNSYQTALLDQQRRAYATFVAAVQNRTEQAYAHRAQELRENESALLLDLARQDAPQRLTLRARLTTLAMSGAQRATIIAQLNAIQAREDRIVAALRARNAVTLNAYRDRLLAQSNADLARMAAQLQARTQANLAQRRDLLAAQRAPAAGLPLGSDRPAAPAGDDVRARVAALRAQGAQAFQSDAQVTVDAYTSAGNDVAARFSAVRGQDVASSQITLAAIARLQRDRAALAAKLQP